jgi:hypothetical protein
MAIKGVEKEGLPGNDPAARRILPRVKFTGQQPGEEEVERDEDDGPDDSEDDEEVDERGLPIGEPSTEGKFSV